MAVIFPPTLHRSTFPSSTPSTSTSFFSPGFRSRLVRPLSLYSAMKQDVVVNVALFTNDVRGANRSTVCESLRKCMYFWFWGKWDEAEDGFVSEVIAETMVMCTGTTFNDGGVEAWQAWQLGAPYSFLITLSSSWCCTKKAETDQGVQPFSQLGRVNTKTNKTTCS